MEEMDAFKAKSDAFFAWFKAIPGAKVVDNIDIADYRDRNAGRGVVATRDIDAGEPLFTLPPSAILSTSTARLPSLLPDVFSDEDLDHWHALILCIIYEFTHAETSFWKPYLDVLPETFETLIHWNNEELQELQASAVRNKVGKEDADDSFRESLLPILNTHKDVFFPDNPRISEEEMLALYHRLASTIMAYAFDLSVSLTGRGNTHNRQGNTEMEGQPDFEDDDDGDSGFATDDSDMPQPKGLIPLADTLNATHPSNAQLEQEPNELIMRATRFIKAGDEVLNTYGALPRSALLRMYGYVDAGYTRFDVVEISLDLIRQFASAELEKSMGMLDEVEGEIDKRLTYLDSKGLVEDGYDLPRPLYLDSSEGAASEYQANSAIPESILIVFRTLLSTPEKFKRARAFLPEDDGPLHVSVYTVLSDLLQARMNEYGTKLDEDRELLKQFKYSRKKMALEVRIGEKEILAAAIAEAQEMLASISGSTKNVNPGVPESNGDNDRPSKRARVT